MKKIRGIWIQAKRKLTFRNLSADFVTERRRPKFDSCRNDTWSGDPRADTAIVLQGPILRTNDFTIESVRRYRTNFPNTPIIVSTWTSEIGGDTEQIEALGGIVIYQNMPANHGVSNSNLQMASTTLGLRKAEQIGVTHVIKSRTDQRLYSERLLGLLHQTLINFPIGINSGSQEQRLIGLSFNTFAYRMYGLSDMFTFGTCADSLKYWDGSFDAREHVEHSKNQSMRDWAKMRICEVRFCSEFLVRTGWSLQWTLEDSWRAFAERFVILDASSVDLFWNNFNSIEEKWRSYEGFPKFAEIDFAWWLQMHGGIAIGNESILDKH